MNYINIAKNKKVTSSNPYYGDNVYQNLVDDNSNTAVWFNDFNQSIMVIDLERKYSIKQIQMLQLYQSNYRCKDFQIFASNNNIDYTLILKNELQPNNDYQSFNINIKESYRYWKLVILNNYKGWSNGLSELKLMIEPYKYLIKKDNKYYSLNNFKDGKFEELNIENIDETSFKTHGFDNINMILDPYNYNDNKIYPINIFNNSEILIYKE